MLMLPNTSLRLHKAHVSPLSRVSRATTRATLALPSKRMNAKVSRDRASHRDQTLTKHTCSMLNMIRATRLFRACSGTLGQGATGPACEPDPQKILTDIFKHGGVDLAYVASSTVQCSYESRSCIVKSRSHGHDGYSEERRGLAWAASGKTRELGLT
jgi:hypothetical protein